MRLARALDADPSPLGAASGTAATPFIFHYPKLIPEGRIETRYYAHVKDIMATCLDLTGATYPAHARGYPTLSRDSRSLLPNLHRPGDREPGDALPGA